MTTINKFEDYFFNKPKTCSLHKWIHYFEIYDRHFSKFIGTRPRILEIGISKGGSLEMWNNYFNGECDIYGIDINIQAEQHVAKLNAQNIHADVGDQQDREFWKEYIKDKQKFDIVIDDGGHSMQQQIVTYEEIYDHINEDGVYLCEDLHTSYWSEYGGGYKKSDTFIEYSKNFIDMLHAHHMKDDHVNDVFKRFRNVTKSVHYYDSVVVLEKGKNPPPSAIDMPATMA
jgi:hypothetical protein